MGDSIIRTLIKRKKKRVEGKVFYLTSLVVDFNERDRETILRKLKQQKSSNPSKNIILYLKSLTAHDVFTIILILITLAVIFML